MKKFPSELMLKKENMEANKEKTSPSSAGCDADRCERTDDSVQKEELNEERNESLFKHEGGQRSITEAQKTKDVEISEEDVQKKVPGRRISRLRSYLRSFFCLDCQRGTEKKGPVYSSKIKGDTVEKRYLALSLISAHYDPDISDVDAGFPLSKQEEDYSPINASRMMPERQAIIPSVSVRPRSVSRNVTLQSSGTEENQKEQTFPIKPTQPEFSLVSAESLKVPKGSSRRRRTLGGSRTLKRLNNTEGSAKDNAFLRPVRNAAEMWSPLISGSIDWFPDDITERSCAFADRESKQFKDGDILLCSPSLSSGQTFYPPKRRDTDDGGPSSGNSISTSNILPFSQSITPAGGRSPWPEGRDTVLQDSTVCTEGSRSADAFELWSVQPESESAGDSDARVEMEPSVTAVSLSVTKTLPTQSQLLQPPDFFRSRRASSCLPRSHSVPSLSQTRSAENKTLTRAESLPDMLLKSSVEEFTPDITEDGKDESYRFLCSCPGLYQCSVTGLVFHMEGEGDVVYRIVPWNRRLLAQHHKQPAGPLFDIKCLQRSVCQLHLPHCEIRSTGGCEFLSVAHVDDDGMEFISPHQVTDTHVIINIRGFSGFGNVKEEDSPPDPVRALVLLFYRPPAAPDVASLLNVLMLPRNVVLRKVQHDRRKLVGEESYIETSSRCKLQPQQEYTLSTCPEDDSVLVQPKKAEFECDNYDNYIPSFQVRLKTIIRELKLLLKGTDTSNIVWESEVCLSSAGVKRSCVQGKSPERLLEIRSSFIGGISGPVLKSLLDKLFERTVMTDPERESADAIQNKSDKARFLIDTVRKKGEAASSEMIEFLREVDPFLCEHLGLI